MDAPVWNALKAIQEDWKKHQVWAKGSLVFDYTPNGAIYQLDPGMWRRDTYGAVIKWTDYGDRSSQYGWEIDHSIPRALGGSDDLSNLRPLHHSNNASLGGGLAAVLAGVRGSGITGR